MGQTLVSDTSVCAIRPPLSVIVTIVDGGEALRRCLQALCEQADCPGLEVIVPYDDHQPVDPSLKRDFPCCSFLALGPPLTAPAQEGAAWQHELIDRRRAAGLAAATGELVAIVEDRGVPRLNWAAAFVRLHQDLPHAAIGGAVANGDDGLLNWAVYFCDFGRYQPPFAAQIVETATDINVCYKREAIAAVRRVWTDRYHEPLVHQALLASGRTIFLSPEPVVDQRRGPLQVRALCAERVAWGRLYGQIRTALMGRLERALRLIAFPAVPFVIFIRLLRGRLTQRRRLTTFLAVSPLVLVLTCAWTLGELQGYLFSRGGQPRRA